MEALAIWHEVPCIELFLTSILDAQFEASDNKAAIVGYSAAAIGALWFSEW